MDKKNELLAWVRLNIQSANAERMSSQCDHANWSLDELIRELGGIELDLEVGPLTIEIRAKIRRYLGESKLLE